MDCRTCGATIADKALVCYKCGAATSERHVEPPRAPSGAARWLPLGLAVVAVAGLAAYLSLNPGGQVSRGLSQIVIGAAVAIVLLRAVLRRR